MKNNSRNHLETRQAKPQPKIYNSVASKRQGFTLPDSKNGFEEMNIEPEVSPSMSYILNVSRNPEINSIERSPAHPILIIAPKTNPWVHGGLRIMFYITKFIRQMKSHSTQLNFRFLTKDMISLIADLASDSDELLKKLTMVSKVAKNVVWALNALPTIEPDSLFKIFWDIFVLIQIVLNIFYIPMKVGFDFENEGYLNSIFLMTLPSWTFVADIVLNFFTAYYSKGQIHRDKKEILRNYTKRQFWWDLLIVIPFILSSFDVSFTQYILLLRITRVKSMIGNLEEILNPSQKVMTFIQLMKQVVFIMFVSHFCACFWNLIGELQNASGAQSWHQQRQIEHAEWETKYINSLYFSTITTLTVGYGDIVPTTNIERIFVIIMAMIICGVLGYTISNIGEILRQLNEKESQFKSQMMFVNNYLKRKQLNKQLQLQVRKYFEYLFKMRLEQNEMGDQLMSELPRNLKEQVAIDIYFNTLLKSRLINKCLSKESVKRLCSYIREERYPPESIIARQKETADKLLFLQKGEVVLICDNTLRETSLAKISAGKFIGEREFIIQGRYDYTIKTSNFTQVAYITYEDFRNVIREDELEDEHFCMIKDSLLFDEDRKNFGQVCFICQWTHQFKNCPLVFLHINREKMKMRWMISEPQQRRFARRNRTHPGKVDRVKMRLDALDLMIKSNIAEVGELENDYLQKLGFPALEDSFTKTFKSLGNDTVTNNYNKQQSNSGGFREFSKEFSMEKQDSVNSQDRDQPLDTSMHGFSSPKRKMGLLKRQVTKESQAGKKVKFTEEPPDTRNLRTQNAAQSRIFNRKQSHKFSILQSSKISSLQNFQMNFMESSQKLNITESDLQIFSKTRTNTSPNMIDELQAEMAAQHDQESNHEREDLDIDRLFCGKLYYPQNNYDIVIAKLQPRRGTDKHIKTTKQIQTLLRKSKA